AAGMTRPCAASSNPLPERRRTIARLCDLVKHFSEELRKSVRRAALAQIRSNRRLFAVIGPAKRRPVVKRVGDIQSCAELDQQADDILMPGTDRLVQRRRMRMEPVRVVAVRIL